MNAAPTQLRRKQEARQRLNVSASQFNRYVAEGKLRVVRFGRRCVRISDAELERFIREHSEIV